MANIGIMTRDFVGTGIDRVVEYQARALASGGHKVVIIAISGNLAPPAGVSLHVFHRPISFVGERLVFLTLPANLRIVSSQFAVLSKFDVLIAHFYPMTWLAEFMRKLSHVKYVLHNHGILDVVSPDQTLLEKTYLKATSLLYTATIGKPDMAISNSNYARLQLGQSTGVESKVIYNPVDTEQFRAGLNASGIRNRHNLGASPVILFVGIIEPRKGIHLLLQVHQLVKKRIPETKLLIVGKTRYQWYFDEIRAAADDSVKLVGWVPANELAAYFAACDVYATASAWESFNLPLVEAQACGKPVVAFDVGAHREIVENGKSGFLIRSGDVDSFANVVTVLLSNTNERQSIGNSGRILVQERFSFQRFSLETKESMRQLV